jgi:hypothetical protein
MLVQTRYILLAALIFLAPAAAAAQGQPVRILSSQKAETKDARLARYIAERLSEKLQKNAEPAQENCDSADCPVLVR